MKFVSRLLFVAVALFLAPGLFAGQEHPGYLHALSDLRAARWLIDHVPGDWARVADEQNAVRKIDDAINEIKIAAIFDGKDINDHPAVDERADHVGRLHAAVDFLRRARADINKEEDLGAVLGLRARAWAHIDEAIRFTEAAIRAVGIAPAPAPVVVHEDHPAYIHALSDLRAARWLIDQTPGNWRKVREEEHAVVKIDDAIAEVKRSSIDDGFGIGWHPVFEERRDHGPRLHQALDFLRQARADIAQEEDNGSVRGLRARAWGHIDEAIVNVERAIRDNQW